MNIFFHPITSSLNHYYHVFTFEYESILQKQIKELKGLRQEIHETLPDSLKVTCTKLIYSLKKAHIFIDNSEMVKQCRSYFHIVHLPQISAIHASKEAIHNVVMPTITHTEFSQHIHHEKTCRMLCNELNISEGEFSSLFVNIQNTLETVNEAVLVRRAVFSFFTIGLALYTFKAFKKKDKQQTRLLACATTIMAITSSFFSGTIETRLTPYFLDMALKNG